MKAEKVISMVEWSSFRPKFYQPDEEIYYDEWGQNYKASYHQIVSKY